ncbi:MAG: hypothetical protein JOY71_16380 [Acetobacteraceae bacterium]|nr:hypothetical protein [Acetobacteraceae bacterium]MBV8523672.1 hypothetical protein [Acetobacteraceae bacterium]MBV8589458.1 hypothetical protein [Acetobacteraceae bacterium]
MDDVFRQAIKAAQEAFPEGVWEHLSGDERAAAIYREMRRIDAERAGKSRTERNKTELK